MFTTGTPEENQEAEALLAILVKNGYEGIATKPYPRQDLAPQQKRQADQWNAAINPDMTSPPAYPFLGCEQILFQLAPDRLCCHTAYVRECGVIGVFMSLYGTPAEAFPGHAVLAVREHGCQREYSLYIDCESDQAAAFWRDQRQGAPLVQADGEAFREQRRFGSSEEYNKACMCGEAKTLRQFVTAAYASFMENKEG
jgi:hypothetical protein